MTTESTAPEPRLGVLVMAYGSPASVDDIETYYTHIRRGRPPAPEQLSDLTARYEAIGGVTRLTAATIAQRDAIDTALRGATNTALRGATNTALRGATNTALRGAPSIARPELSISIGQRHAFPFIEDGVDELVEAGAQQIVGVVMAPHFSKASIGAYEQRLRSSASERGVDSTVVSRWWNLEPFVNFYANAIRSLRAAATGPVHTLFTAHSLPESALVGDPYPDELFEGAQRIASAAGLSQWADWSICWQSAGRTPEPWRGPDILSVLADLAGTGRAGTVIVCPHGFTADHLEVAYDIDIEAKALADRLGLRLVRTPTIGADPATMASIAGAVLDEVSSSR